MILKSSKHFINKMQAFERSSHWQGKINRYSEIYKWFRCEASSIGMQINIHSDIWSIDTRRSSKCLRCESGVQLQREILLSDGRELFYFYSIFRLFECAFCQMCSSKKHVTRVCVLSQSAYEKHNQEKSPQTFAHFVNFSEMCLPCFIITKHFVYRINKPFTGSRCFIFVSCSVHMISTCAKDHRLFYPQINEVRKASP